MLMEENEKEIGCTQPEDWCPLLGINVTKIKDFPNETVVKIVPEPMPTVSHLKLGLEDQGLPQFWTTTLYAFPNHSQELDDTRLQSSLKLALGNLPVLSGKIMNINGDHFDHSKPKTGEIMVEFSGEGIWFTSSTQELDFEALKQDMFSTEIHTKSFLFKKAQIAILKNTIEEPAPLLAIKVTHFKTGGAVITVMVNHLVADGRSMYLFMKLWGQLYRNVHPDPVIDQRILAPSPLELSARGQEFIKAWESHVYPAVPHDFPFKTVRFSIQVERITQLKNQINEYLHPRWVSMDDLMCAIVWRSAIKARRLPTSTFTSLERVSDIRQQLGLNRDQAFGNHIIWYRHNYITVDELINQPLAELAYSFRQELKNHNSEFINDILSAIYHMENKGKSAHFINAIKLPNILASSYARFNPQEVQFHVPSIANLRVPYPSGQLHPHHPTPTHHFAMIGMPLEFIPQVLQDTELLSLGFQIETAPFATTILP